MKKALTVLVAGVAGFFGCLAPAMDPAEVEKILNGISSKEVTLDAFLGKLPQEYRRNYLEIYSTRSKQFASAKQPRIVAYGKDAKFIFAYGGNKAHGSYNTLEMV